MLSEVRSRYPQVWFSTQLDLSAKRSLLRVGKRLKREAVSGWAGNSLKISDGLQVSEGEVSKTFAGMGVYLQGDTSACSKPPVDIDLKVAF